MNEDNVTELKHQVFQLREKTAVLQTHPFTVEKLELNINDKPTDHPWYRLDCPDWVNVLPITSDNQAVLIRQPRAGNLKNVLEIPAGVIEKDEKDPTLAAQRELEEETGFTSQRILSLGSLSPNPAIQNNRCHFFLAMGCVLNPDRQHFPDPQEFIQVQLTPMNELEELVRSGVIDNSLCALNVMLALKYLKTG